MELDAVKGKVAMHEAHNFPVFASRRDDEIFGYTLFIDDERVVSRCKKGSWDITEKRGIVMSDRGDLTVHRIRTSSNDSSEGSGNGLMAKTDA